MDDPLPRLTVLDGLVDKTVSLTPRAWAMALLLGQARQKSNDEKRAAVAERGLAGNQAVDLHGSLGELILLRSALRHEASQVSTNHMRQHMFNPAGGQDVEGADLYLEEDGRLHGIDMKSFDCEPNKRFFAINNDKHLALAGRCSAYLGLVTPRFSSRAIISRLVPYGAVEPWDVWPLRRGGNPSRNFPIEKFMGRYTSSASSFEELWDSCLAQAEVMEAAHARGHGTAHHELLELLPSLSLLP